MPKVVILIHAILMISMIRPAAADEHAKRKLRIASADLSKPEVKNTDTPAKDRPVKSDSSSTANPLPGKSGKRGLSTAFWVGLSGTAVTGVLTAVFWGLTESSYRKFQDSNEEIEGKPIGDPSLHGLVADRNRKKQDTETFGNTAVAFSIAASVLAAATIITLITDYTGAGFGKVRSEKSEVAAIPGGLMVRF